MTPTDESHWAARRERARRFAQAGGYPALAAEQETKANWPLPWPTLAS